MKDQAEMLSKPAHDAAADRVQTGHVSKIYTLFIYLSWAVAVGINPHPPKKKTHFLLVMFSLNLL